VGIYAFSLVKASADTLLAMFMSPSPPPIVILVRPQMGENIGAAARAMMNFGLADLRLVAPRDGWPNKKAHEMAAKAEEIIAATTVYETLADALHDSTYALAASARIRASNIMCKDVRPAMEEIRRTMKQTALVFGQENNGLSNGDISHCHALMTIPTHPDNASLNLAQSVGIVAYEWWVASDAVRPPPPLSAPPATAAEVNALYNRLHVTLEERGYFVEGHATLQEQKLRALLTRPMFSAEEVQAWQGIVKLLSIKVML
jgi:tRNA/rRNA methyltransferase